MRGFGVVVLIVGVLVIVGAMSMDVSVSSGIGRVNNLGLMAERQNYTLIGGIVALAGLLMTLLGGRKHAGTPVAESDTRACPICAESIKRAAIKCKHCGTDVEPEKTPKLLQGWVARVSCRDDEERDRARQCLEEIDLDVVPMMDKDVGAGPYATKGEALAAARLIGETKKLYATAIYRDIVTGTYPPL